MSFNIRNALSNAFVGSPPSYSADVSTFLSSDTKAEAVAALDAKLVTAANINPMYVVSFKDITVLTSGTPADIASVTLPTWLTRWRIFYIGNYCIGETAAGTLAAANFTLRDAAAGAGNAQAASFAGPASAGTSVGITNTGPTSTLSNGTTLYLRQTANSANAGTISVYLIVMPYL